MSELFDNNAPYSVSELAGAIKRTIETGFGEVRVRGELGRVMKAASGHMYFDLKDENAVINACWFKGAQRKVPQGFDQGLEVIVTGKLSTYPSRSNYQLIVSTVELAGVGALLKLIEDRKKKLAAEGLFEEGRKRALPYLPRVIGLVTSASGAVLHDIMHRLQDRYMPHVLLWPVLVQGDEAAAQVKAAVEGFNNLPAHIPTPDLLIIARGGGSVEDLMPFNDEALVRAVAASKIPTISAIGHETDWTLIDLAADWRAPTPTGAAERAVPVKAELVATVDDLGQRLKAAPLRQLREYRSRLLEVRAPHSLLQNMSQKLDDRATRLASGLQSWLQARRLQLVRLHLRSPAELLRVQQHRLETLASRLAPQQVRRAVQPAQQALQRLSEKLELLSYQNTLRRGYAVVLDGNGHLISSAGQTPDAMKLRFADGDVQVKKV